MSMSVVSAGRRRGSWRWLVALLATVLLVVSGSGLVAFAQSGSGTSRGPSFVPAGTALYVVGRLDLPEGQGDALAAFLTAFPGFADAGSFELKMQQALDGLVGQISDGAMSYSGELESFLTGEVALAIPDLSGAAMTGQDPDILVGLATSDAGAAQSFIDLLTAGATDATTETYGSTSIVSNADMAIAVAGDWILLSQTADQVKAAIDVLDGDAPSLADDEDFAAAWTRVPGASLAALYLDLGSFASIIGMAGSMAAGQLGGMSADELLAQLPKDLTAYLAASPDRLTLEAFITPSDQATMTFSVGESDLAASFPADTQVYIEARELGTTIETALTGLLGMMDAERAASMEPVESMLGVPLPTFFDFVSDAALGGSLTSDGLWLGIAAEVTDDEVAATRVERLMSMVRLMGAQNPDITIEETTIGEQPVTVITLPIDEALSGSGMPITVGDTISVTVANGELLIGTGDFVTHALAMQATDSLAMSPGYVDALGGATTNAGVAYVNVSSLLTGIEPMLSAMVPQWADVAPYLGAIDRIVAVGDVSDVISTRISVIVDHS